LAYRLKEHTHEEALRLTEKEYGWGQTIISKAWASFKVSALARCRNARANGFTPEETASLCDIFEGEEWFLGSETVRKKLIVLIAGLSLAGCAPTIWDKAGGTLAPGKSQNLTK
jgi:hypothetical protein